MNSLGQGDSILSATIIQGASYKGGAQREPSQGLVRRLHRKVPFCFSFAEQKSDIFKQMYL